MRKKTVTFLLILCASIAFFGCTKRSGNVKIEKGQNSVSDILQADLEKDSEEEDSEEVANEENYPKPALATTTDPGPAAEEGIDIDLTRMSSNMVYSEVYNMISTPDDYIGKTVKMNGLFTLLSDEVTGNIYYGCIVQDATACCASGIEFAPKDSYSYPDDYPEDGGEVTVIGTFSTYTEDGELYCTLKDADFWKE
jgi:hypothetical protein